MQKENATLCEETRNGFFVSEIMKRTWAAQLKILKAIEDICKRHRLSYFAEGGTLLGAYRHKGFIPWDDDLDICMFREDYARFLHYADELPDDLCLRSIYNNERFTSFHAVVANNADDLCWDDERMEKYCGCPFICYVDIYPLDYIPKDEKRQKIVKLLYYLGYRAAQDCVSLESRYFKDELVTLDALKHISQDNDSFEFVTKVLKELDEFTVEVNGFFDKDFKFDTTKPLRNQLYILTDTIGQICMCEDSEAVHESTCYATDREIAPLDKKWFRECLEVPFEHTTISVPVDAEEILKKAFGNDFMKPVMFTSLHGYPFFRSEVRAMVGGDIGDIYRDHPVEIRFLEMLDTLSEALDIVRGLIPRNTNAAIDTIIEMQNVATAVGESIENTFRDNAYPISNLEEFCEGVYELSLLISSDNNDDIIESKENELEQLISRAKQEMFREIHRDDLENVPDRWKDKIFDDNGKKKRVILYGLSSTDVVNAGEMASKVVKQMIGRMGSGEMAIVCMASGLLDFIDRCGLSMKEGFLNAIGDIKDNDSVLFLDNMSGRDVAIAVALCDEYCGDESRLCEICKMAGKNITIQNYRGDGGSDGSRFY